MPKNSKHGGIYQRVFFKDMNNKSYFLDVYDSHADSRKWLPYIKTQALFDNVSIFKKNIINGKSNFVYLGQKQ